MDTCTSKAHGYLTMHGCLSIDTSTINAYGYLCIHVVFSESTAHLIDLLL